MYESFYLDAGTRRVPVPEILGTNFSDFWIVIKIHIKIGDFYDILMIANKDGATTCELVTPLGTYACIDVGGEFAPNAGAHAGRDWGAFDIQKEVIDLCPTKCMKYEGGKLAVNTPECTRCMHCINTMPRALRVGDDRGCSLLVGAKAPILDGAQMGSLLVPFVEVNPDNEYQAIKDVIEPLWDWWMENGKNRERVGELIKRQGFRRLLEETGIEPVPQHVQEPRTNPYIFWKEEEVEGGWTRDIDKFRKDHLR